MGLLRRRTDASIHAVAERALSFCQASNPLTLAHGLGFELLPCAPDIHVELKLTTCFRIAFSAVADKAKHDELVLLALARGLLLREAVAHEHGDVYALARLLRRPPGLPAQVSC